MAAVTPHTRFTVHVCAVRRRCGTDPAAPNAAVHITCADYLLPYQSTVRLEPTHSENVRCWSCGLSPRGGQPGWTGSRVAPLPDWLSPPQQLGLRRRAGRGGAGREAGSGGGSGGVGRARGDALEASPRRAARVPEAGGAVRGKAGHQPSGGAAVRGGAARCGQLESGAVWHCAARAPPRGRRFLPGRITGKCVVPAEPVTSSFVPRLGSRGEADVPVKRNARSAAAVSENLGLFLVEVPLFVSVNMDHGKVRCSSPEWYSSGSVPSGGACCHSHLSRCASQTWGGACCRASPGQATPFFQFHETVRIETSHLADFKIFGKNIIQMLGSVFLCVCVQC